MNMKCIFTLLLAAIFVVSCDRSGSTAIEGIPVDSNTVLCRITGLTGLIEYGDELVAMTYPLKSREARIRQENIDAAQFSLLDRKSNSDVMNRGKNRLVKIPDVQDETKHRFFYFERIANGALVFRGVCSESWGKGRPSDSTSAVCDVTYPLGELIVHFEVSEKDFITHGEAIAKRVLDTVREKQ